MHVDTVQREFVNANASRLSLHELLERGNLGKVIGVE